MGRVLRQVRADTPMHQWNWSREEKIVARTVFDRALKQELEAVIREAKERVAKIQEPCELWELEDWLTQRRKEIDRKYDFRYSVLPLVFARLIYEGRLREDDLQGLGVEKLDLIRMALRP